MNASWAKQNEVIKRARRFLIIGLGVTFLHVLVASILIETILPQPSAANGIAFVISTMASYICNTLWSFSRAPAIANLMRFLVVSLCGLFLAMSLAALVEYLGFSYWIGIASIVTTIPVLTFSLHTIWTYKE